jgi:hypothetical protein
MYMASNYFSEKTAESLFRALFCDRSIVHYDTLSNVSLREHIDRVGRVIFEASQDAVVSDSLLESALLHQYATAKAILASPHAEGCFPISRHSYPA